MKQIRHYLPEWVVPVLQSESLSGKCAKLHTMAASNNRDHNLTFFVTSNMYYGSLASQASLEVIHQDHSIGSTPLLLVSTTIFGCNSSRTSRSWWIAHSKQCQPRGCNTTLGPVMLINRMFDISCKLDISRNLSTFLSQLHLRRKLKFCHIVPSPRGVFCGLSSSATKL